MKVFKLNKTTTIIIIMAIVSVICLVIQKIIEDNSSKEEIIFAEENTNIVESNVKETELDDNIEETEELQEIEQTEEKIYVYITGEVNNPGVVTLNKGSRIIDAINAVGGTTSDADVSKVNLVFVLEDGTKVNIPNKSAEENVEYVTTASGDDKDDYDKETKSSNSSEKSKNSMVNINTATQTELETLPGIGPSLALKIINYRQEQGKFSSIDDIRNVSGIGDSKFENIKNLICI